MRLAGVPVIQLREVGPRDGLQSLPKLPAEAKVNLVDELSSTGLDYIEVCSFVNPLYIPQMADAEKVFAGIKKTVGIDYAVLVPNPKHYFLARECGVQAIAVFISSNELHNKRNVGLTIKENKEVIEQVVGLARRDGLKVRAYLSCVWGYANEPTARESAVADGLAGFLWQLGADEVSVADTTSLSTPKSLEERLKRLSDSVSLDSLSVHLHCRGSFEDKIDAALDAGIKKFDCSIGGFGGHMPDYLIGNVATERLARYLEDKGLRTGLQVETLEKIALEFRELVGNVMP